MSSTHQRSSANARIACAQPIGDDHDRRPSPMSPTARATNEATRTTPLNASAERGVAAICDVTAVSEAKTEPAPTSDTAKAIVPATGSPLIASTSPTPAATATVEMRAQSNAAAVPAYRPTGAARVNSAFSVVSSVRVCRTTTKMFISATAMITQTASSFIITAPSVGSSSPYPGPAWTMSVVLPRTSSRVLLELGGSRVEPGDALHRRDDDADQAGDPQHDPQPVAPQREPEQVIAGRRTRTRAPFGARRRGAAVCGASRRTVNRDPSSESL